MLPTFKPQFRSDPDAAQQYTYATTLGNRCYLRARAADGRPVFVEQNYTPTYFLPTDIFTGDQGFDGTPLLPHYQTSIREGRAFLKEHPEAYGNIQCEYQLLADVYGTTDIVPDMDRLLIWNIDIENPGEQFATVEDPHNPVLTITVKKRHMGQQEIVVYGYGDYVTRPGETFVKCKDEDELLRAFVRDWRNKGNYPDIVTGWNVQFFDIPYLVRRMERLWGERAETVMNLSPFRDLNTREVVLFGQAQTVIDVRGVAILDYLELYKKFTYTQRENYRLDTIAHIELGRRKVSYKEYHSLHTLYKDNYQKFVEYNIADVELVDALDEKLKMLELVCALAYSAKANYVDTFKQVRLWDVMIYHYLRGQGKQIPPKVEGDKTEQYAGAFVKPPQVGLHRWVVSFDVASMYPHIIREWNLSPETITGRKVEVKIDDLLQEKPMQAFQHDADLTSLGYAMAANGVLVHRHTEGFLPVMLKTLYDERTRFKKLANDAKKEREAHAKGTPEYDRLTKQIAAFNNQQMVRKVNLNSAYGALGSQYFRFYNTDMAEAVTLTGQFVLRFLVQRVNAFLNTTFGTTNEDYVIAGDTDSIYVRLDRAAERLGPRSVQKMVTALDAFCEHCMQPVLDRAFGDIATYLNVYVPCLTMKREVIAEKGIWSAKKRYVLDVWDQEGVRYQTPKLKMMGIETVQSTTPTIVRDLLTEAITLVLRGTEPELWDFVEHRYAQFCAAPFEDVAFGTSVNGVTKYAQATKSVPIHVRAALVYNRAIASLPEYEPITDGQKIKWAYLREPNSWQSDVIAAPDGCPPEWNVERTINYHTQWEIAFLKPLQVFLDCVGWSTEQQPSLF